MNLLHVGIENWVYGPSSMNRFPFVLGDGSDVALSQIWGSIAGGPVPLANRAGQYVRQSLTALFSPALSWGAPAAGKTIAEPPPGTHFGIDNHIAAWNIKQSGNEVVHIPIAIKFGAPLVIPGGQLMIVVNSETLVPKTSKDSTDGNECLDTELHLTFEFECATPRG